MLPRFINIAPPMNNIIDIHAMAINETIQMIANKIVFIFLESNMKNKTSQIIIIIEFIIFNDPIMINVTSKSIPNKGLASVAYSINNNAKVRLSIDVTINIIRPLSVLPL